MRVTLVPSSIARDRGGEPGQYLISYLINDAVCIDAGSIGLYGTPREQAGVRHILISHTHIDHTASLPVFVENAYEAKADCVTIHGSEWVLETLQRDVFNNRLWPDFIALSAGPQPLLKLGRLEPFRPLLLEGLTITPVPMSHVVPTLGFVITDANGTVVIASDTGPTEDLWRVANAAPGLAAVYLESSFPNGMSELAATSMHLTPALFGGEVRKLARPVPVVAVHIKARYKAEVSAELLALGLPNVELGRYGFAYDW